MALSDAQKAELQALAKEKGVDPAALVAEAERIAGAPKDGKPPVPGAKPPGTSGGPPHAPGVPSPGVSAGPTFPCHLLPFVTVKELRASFLHQAESFPGDDQVASDWAKAHPGPDDDDDSTGSKTPPEDASGATK